MAIEKNNNFQFFTGIFQVVLQILELVEGVAMEKTWENFWTTGKVEDYLSYRNSVSEKEEASLSKEERQAENRQEGMRSTWDSR